MSRQVGILKFFRGRGESSAQVAGYPAEAPQSINQSVVTEESRLLKAQKRRGAYHHLDPEVKLKIGRYAAENSNKGTVLKFRSELGFSLSESTVRSFKKTYFKKLQNPTSVPPRLGRPLLLTKNIDDKVLKYVKQLRLSGCPVNRNIVVAAAKGFVNASSSKHILLENGGGLDIGPKWAESFLNRNNFVRRKATKAARALPDDFENTRKVFLQRISDICVQNNIPSSNVVNIDQTGTKMVPVSEWTLNECGATQVTVKSLDDKREITLLFGVIMSGVLLPPQVVYAGKSVRCHPQGVDFPGSWHITHSPNHWSTSETMLEYIEHVLVPYFTKVKKSKQQPHNQKCLLILDVFSAHRTQEFLSELDRNDILVIFVPARCTSKLQPLDVAVNDVFKKMLKAEFTGWYAEKVRQQLVTGKDPSEININLGTAAVKPIHAQWLISTITSLSKKSDLLKSAFERAGIVSSKSARVSSRSRSSARSRVRSSTHSRSSTRSGSRSSTRSRSSRSRSRSSTRSNSKSTRSRSASCSEGTSGSDVMYHIPGPFDDDDDADDDDDDDEILEPDHEKAEVAILTNDDQPNDDVAGCGLSRFRGVPVNTPSLFARVSGSMDQTSTTTMQNNLNLYGLKIKGTTRADGNCFFHAVCDQLVAQDIAMTAAQLRKRLAEFLDSMTELEQDEYRNFIVDSDWKSYVQKALQNCWALIFTLCQVAQQCH